MYIKSCIFKEIDFILNSNTILPYHFQIKETSTFFFFNVDEYSEEIPDS